MSSKPSRASRSLSFSQIVVVVAAAALLVTSAHAQSCPRFEGLWPDGPAGNVRGLFYQANRDYYGVGKWFFVADVRVRSFPKVLSRTRCAGPVSDVELAGGYAYVAAGVAGLHVFDLANPDAPVLVGTVNTPASATGLAVVGTLVYIADQTALRIVDASVPTAPVIIGTRSLPGLSSAVAVVGTTAYVASGAQGMHVVDVSNPAAPTLLATFATPTDAGGVAVAGSFAYVACATGAVPGSLVVVDVSNPTMPRRVGAVDTISGNRVVVFGTHAYESGNQGLAIVDIAVPAAPRLSSIQAMPQSAWDVSVSGSYAHVAADTAGVQIVNVSNPASPSIVGVVDVSGQAQDVAVTGTKAYVAGLGRGFHVLDVSDPTTPTLIGTVATNRACGVAISGNHAYLADYLQFTVVDVTDPTSPIVIGSATSTLGLYLRVAVAGNLAYTTGSQLLNNALTVWNISSPSAPFAVGSIGMGSAQDVAAQGSHAYVANRGGGLAVVDVTDPTAPAVVGTATPPGEANGVAVSGALAYVASDTGLHVVDVTDPTLPFIVGSINTGTVGLRVAVSGTYAFLEGDDRLDVIDVSDPTTPFLVGTKITADEADGVAAANGHVYAAKSTSGVEIFDPYDCCTAAPGALTITAPADGTFVTPPVLLDWDDSPQAVAYDVYLDTNPIPTTLVVSGLATSSTVLATTPYTQYYAKVVARNACGTVESAVLSFITGPPKIDRYDSRAAMVARTPSRTFLNVTLPWLDPEAVLDSSAPDLQFYDLFMPGTDILVFKDVGTIRIEAR